MPRITQREKIRMYERLLHDLYFASHVTMDSKRVGTLLENIGRWSYSHRAGNGQLSDRQQNEMINSAFRKLCIIKE